MVAVVSATNGSKIYIGGSVATTVDTASEFAALSYNQINGCSEMGAFGDTAAEITFDVIDESRTRKQKGTRNAGNMQLVMAYDPNDAGQADLQAAQLTALNYAFKVEWNDKLSTSGTNTIRYFQAKVMTDEANLGSANNIITRRVLLGIDSAIIEVPAT